ncbi:MAG: sigma-70 family RNA polymerase sigma factor [Myxococcales bacterium]
MAGDLLTRVKAREPGAQRELRSQVFPRALAVCRSILRDEALAEEVAEDLWTDFLVSHVGSLRSLEALPAYLRLMAVRRAGRVQELRARHDELPERLPDARPGAESVLVEESERRRLALQLRDCLGALRPRSRQMVRLRFSHGMTQEQIGSELGFTKQHVGRVLAKSLAALRQCLEGRP